MPPPQKDGVLEVHGMFFLYSEEEIWLWSEKQQVWSALPHFPPYLVIVRDKLAVIDVKTSRPKCNCGPFQVNNFGCLCGGV